MCTRVCVCACVRVCVHVIRSGVLGVCGLLVGAIICRVGAYCIADHFCGSQFL